MLHENKCALIKITVHIVCPFLSSYTEHCTRNPTCSGNLIKIYCGCSTAKVQLKIYNKLYSFHDNKKVKVAMSTLEMVNIWYISLFDSPQREGDLAVGELTGSTLTGMFDNTCIIVLWPNSDLSGFFLVLLGMKTIKF